MLAIISKKLEKKYAAKNADVWKNSPHGWIKKLPSRKIGMIGELLVLEYAKELGYAVRKSGTSQFDLYIQNFRVEVKFSTLWENNVFVFQQIRDYDYDYVCFLGISPTAEYLWFVPKKILNKYVIGHLPQHKGAEGVDTFWIKFAITEIPEWLHAFGGELSEVYIRKGITGIYE